MRKDTIQNKHKRKKKHQKKMMEMTIDEVRKLKPIEKQAFLETRYKWMKEQRSQERIEARLKKQRIERFKKKREGLCVWRNCENKTKKSVFCEYHRIIRNNKAKKRTWKQQMGRSVEAKSLKTHKHSPNKQKEEVKKKMECEECQNPQQILQQIEQEEKENANKKT